MRLPVRLQGVAWQRQGGRAGALVVAKEALDALMAAAAPTLLPGPLAPVQPRQEQGTMENARLCPRLTREPETHPVLPLLPLPPPQPYSSIMCFSAAVLLLLPLPLLQRPPLKGGAGAFSLSEP